jgi:polyhydroxyalkanoate synthesis regulator phasin
VLNLYDTEAVKDFIFDILVENQELKKQLQTAQKFSDMWFVDSKTHKERADKAEARIAELEQQIAKLTAGQTQEGGEDNDHNE